VGTPLFALKIGESGAFGGILVATFVISTVVARLFTGSLVDLLTRRKVMMAGAAAVLFGGLLPILLPSIPTQFIARVFIGVGFAAAQTAVGSAASDILPKERLGEGFGYATMGQAVGMACGSVLAIWLVGFDYLGMLSVGITGAAAALLLLGASVNYEKDPLALPPTAGFRVAFEQRSRELPQAGEHGDEPPASEPQAAKRENPLFEKTALGGALPVLFIAFSIAVFSSYSAVFADSMGYANPQWFFLIAATVSVIVRFTTAKLMDSAKPVLLYLVPVSFAVATLLAMYFITSELAYYVLGIGFGICQGITVPLLASVAIKASPPHRFGPANALFFLLFDLGIGAGVILWGFIVDISGFLFVFVGGAAAAVISYLVALLSFREPKPR